ncbi:MAG: choice-of-anchor tandem repeat GloVer-containing protein [Alphaproteobacteria bacterium]|jgi:uncharacterized repeat protein (TIGR03803 family)
MNRALQIGGCAAAITVVIAAFAPLPVYAAKERVLYSFAGGSDGAFPEASLVMDAQGNLYGTTEDGGSVECGGSGCGTVFKLAPDGTETVLHAFSEMGDGVYPIAALALDSAGNLYGTTFKGGDSGGGVVFRVTPKGKETLLHSFGGGSDGSRPDAGLVIDDAGNFYGTTSGGGAAGHGTVFRITPSGGERVIYSFAGGSDGAYPAAGLVRDAAGNFYGTTANGGLDCDGTGQGCGTVFRVTPKGKETVLYAFEGDEHGANPAASVVMDAGGNLYGTTNNGGVACDDSGATCGTVFKLAANGKETGLHIFTGGSDGAYARSTLVLDSNGALFGTTASGGAGGGECGCGVVFKIPRRGEEKILHTFAGDDVHSPFAGVIMDASGNLYGTGFVGGANGGGGVFEILR